MSKEQVDCVTRLESPHLGQEPGNLAKRGEMKNTSNGSDSVMNYIMTMVDGYTKLWSELFSIVTRATNTHL